MLCYEWLIRVSTRFGFFFATRKVGQPLLGLSVIFQMIPLLVDLTCPHANHERSIAPLGLVRFK